MPSNDTVICVAKFFEKVLSDVVQLWFSSLESSPASVKEPAAETKEPSDSNGTPQKMEH